MVGFKEFYAMLKHETGKLIKQVYGRVQFYDRYFSLYINDLTNSLKTNVKLFADDIALVSEICDLSENTNVLNHYLRKICEGAEKL